MKLFENMLNIFPYGVPSNPPKASNDLHCSQNMFVFSQRAPLSPAETQKATVRQSMDEYKSLTGGCITFVERTNERDYIHFTQE